jgi:hypothetical protein
MYTGENAFGEDAETLYTVRGHPAAAKHLAEELLGRDVDVAYAYEPGPGRVLPAAFVNTLRFLGWDGQGFPYPTTFMSINCHGRRLVKTHGGLVHIGEFGPDADDFDPPSPSPRRCFDVGAAVGEVLAASPWRVAVIASSSWSHSFLTEHTMFLRPDGDHDRQMYELLANDKLDTWRDIPLAEIEHAGEHEMLNWFCLAGAVTRLGLTRRWSEFIESDVFASNKCFAVYDDPNAG